MSGEGKYTVYAPPAGENNDLLNKLFRSDDPIRRPIVQDLVGKETEARSAVLALARANLQPAHQAGDLGHFPSGVDLDFSYRINPALAPDTAVVAWDSPGDAANAYAPDITSPGPGKTDGLDKADDPQISVGDLKPNYVPGAPGTGTRSPLATHAKIVAANLLGVPGRMGDSGANS